MACRYFDGIISPADFRLTNLWQRNGSFTIVADNFPVNRVRSALLAGLLVYPLCATAEEGGSGHYRHPLVKKDATDMKSLLGTVPHQPCVQFMHPRKAGHSHTGIPSLPGVFVLDPDAAEGRACSNG